MTNEELEHFADIIAEKVFKLIMERQAEFDEQFIRQVQNAGQDIEITLQQDVFGNTKGQTVEEYLLAELARLLTLQQSYLEKENYEKAAVIRDKITKIEEIDYFNLRGFVATLYDRELAKSTIERKIASVKSLFPQKFLARTQK